MVCGAWTIGLGVWHLGVPRWFAFGAAVETTAGEPPRSLGHYRLGALHYARRPADVVGLGWVMSNAASMVLITIGLVDIGWAVGDRTIPIVVGAWWVAGWWAVRAGSQLLIGRRPVDAYLIVLFVALAILHVATAVTS